MRPLPLFLFIWLVSSLGAAVPARAENAPPEEALLEKVQKLQALKESDPESYRRIIEEKQGKVRERLDRFRTQNGGRYEAFLEKRQNVRQKRFEFVRERNPQFFRQFEAHRRDRIERFRERNPLGQTRPPQMQGSERLGGGPDMMGQRPFVQQGQSQVAPHLSGGQQQPVRQERPRMQQGPTPGGPHGQRPQGQGPQRSGGGGPQRQGGHERRAR